jgi:hypothetical protein
MRADPSWIISSLLVKEEEKNFFAPSVMHEEFSVRLYVHPAMKDHLNPSIPVVGMALILY